jgi:hypothetical protein
MGKRFVDTEIWRRPWYRALSLAEREAWRYLTDTCDAIGIWIPDFEAAEFFIGRKVDWTNLPSKLNGNVEVLPSGKWFLVDFCEFQYGQLDPNSKSPPIMSYISQLKKQGIWERVLIGYGKGIDRDKEKEKEKEKVKEEEKEKDGENLKPVDNLALPDSDPRAHEINQALKSIAKGMIYEGEATEEAQGA